MKNSISELQRIIRQLKLDEKAPSQLPSSMDWKQILVMAQYNMLSEAMAQTLLYQIEQDTEYLRDFPDFLHRAPTSEQFYAQGRPDIELGHLVADKNLRIGVKLKGPLFAAISGLTGAGKSTALRVLLKAIHEHNCQHPDEKVCIIVLDRKGGDFADLPSAFGWEHYHIRHMRLALENPEGMAPEVWINTVASLFCARAGLNYAWTVLVSVLQCLLGLLNPNPEGRLLWPDFHLIRDFIKSFPERQFGFKAEYTRSLLQQLEAICRFPYDTFKALQGFSIEDLIVNGESAVIAMPNMEPSWIRQFFTDVLISQVLRGRIERSQRSDRVQVLFVIEEGNDDVNIASERLFGGGMSPITECFKKGREFGVGVGISLSSLGTVPPLIRENATTHLVFRPGGAEATFEAARTLMLESHQAQILGHLQPGESLIKQIGPWPHAVKAQIDYMPPSCVHVSAYDSHPFTEAVPIQKLPAVVAFIKQYRRNDSKQATDKTKSDGNPIETAARRLIVLAAKHPFVPVARLFDRIETHHYQEHLDIRALIDNYEWAKFEETRIGRSNVLLIEVTPAGYQMAGLPQPRGNKGRGRIAHRTFSHWIMQQHVKQGRKAYIEWVPPGTNHPVDVAVELEGQYDVYEVCVTAMSNLISHIEKTFQSSAVRSLTFVTGTKKQLKALRRDLNDNLLFLRHAEQIKFETIDNYVIRGIDESD